MASAFRWGYRPRESAFRSHRSWTSNQNRVCGRAIVICFNNALENRCGPIGTFSLIFEDDCNCNIGQTRGFTCHGVSRKPGMRHRRADSAVPSCQPPGCAVRASGNWLCRADLATTLIIASWITSRRNGWIGSVPLRFGLKTMTAASPSTGSIFSTSCGRYNVPPFPSAAMKRATCNGVTCTVALTDGLIDHIDRGRPDRRSARLLPRSARCRSAVPGQRRVPYWQYHSDDYFGTRCSRYPRRTDCRNASGLRAGLTDRRACCRRYYIPCPLLI